MAKPIGKRKARRLAFENAAALAENADLSELFGDDVLNEHDDEESAERLATAQADVVAYLKRAAARVRTTPGVPVPDHRPIAPDTLAQARQLLVRCLPIIQYDAQMMADITRHAPLDAESQAKHDSTEYESEKLVREIPAFLGGKGDAP